MLVVNTEHIAILKSKYGDLALTRRAPAEVGGTFLPFGPLSLPFGSEWILPTSELSKQSRPTRCPEADALCTPRLFAPLCSSIHDRAASWWHPWETRSSSGSLSSKADTTSPDQPASSSLPSTAHPDRRDTVKLSVLTSRPLLAGLLLRRGRLALSRPRPASSTEGRRSRQSAPFAAALCIERALLAPVSAGRTRSRPGPALRNFC